MWILHTIYTFHLTDLKLKKKQQQENMEIT